MSHTLVTLWTEARQRLEAAGVETPVFDARLLVEAGAGVSRMDIITEPRRPLSEAQVAAVDALVRRRSEREPMAYVLGRKQFWTLDLAVGADVLIPRPESELVVEAALAAIAPDVPARVIDLGVGSGAILLAILSERRLATGVGIDLSEHALAIAQANAETAGLADRIDLRVTDWWDGVDGVYDIVVSNPPYIASDEIPLLAPEVARFEPRLALDGGSDGLNAYRAIIAGMKAHLRPSGVFALEVGRDQAAAVMRMALDAGFRIDEPRLDLAGAARVIIGQA